MQPRKVKPKVSLGRWLYEHLKRLSDCKKNKKRSKWLCQSSQFHCYKVYESMMMIIMRWWKDGQILHKQLHNKTITEGSKESRWPVLERAYTSLDSLHIITDEEI